MEDGIPRRLQHRHKTCCEKGGHCGRRACRVQRWHHCGDVVFRTDRLVYDNEILRDLINTGKVAAFIDDIIVGTESEEEHNKLVEEIIKRLEENNLYVKPEKCK